MIDSYQSQLSLASDILLVARLAWMYFLISFYNKNNIFVLTVRICALYLFIVFHHISHRSDTIGSTWVQKFLQKNKLST